MLIKTCLACSHHRVKNADEGELSYCSKENCWSVYSDCITRKAVEKFLRDDALTVFMADEAPSNSCVNR